MAVLTCTDAATLATNIAAAVYGDELRLTENVLFTAAAGAWTFPVKSGWTDGLEILVTTTATTGLPAAGIRTGPAFAAKMPKLQATQTSALQNSPSIQVASGAKGWRFQHIEIRQSYYGSGSMVRVGLQEASQYKKSQQPENIYFDQCYWNTTLQPYWLAKRGIERHGKNISVTNSYFEAIGTPSDDSQCVWDCNGYGPYALVNNYLLGSTENYLTLGDDPKMRTAAICGASPAPTTTSAYVDWSASEHADADPPAVGAHIAIMTQGGTMRRHAWVSAFTADGASAGTITFSKVLGTPTAIDDVPAVGGDIRWGAIPGGITILNNHILKPIAWRDNNVLPTPAGVSAAASATGTLAAGNYNVRVAGRVVTYQGSLRSSAASTAIIVTVTAGQKIVVNWSAVADVAEYRVYVQMPDASWRYLTIASGTLTATFDDPTDGAVISGVTSAAVWSVKTGVEIKGCVNAEIANNIIEQMFPGIDAGSVLWIKSVNQGGNAEWVVAKNIEIHHNIIRDCLGVISVASREFYTASQTDRPGQLDGLNFHDNYCYNTGTDIWAQGKSNWGFSIEGGKNVTIKHNTFIHTQKGSIRLLVNVTKGNYITPNFVITDNLFIRNTYGVRGQSSLNLGEGTTALNDYSQGSYTFTNNVIADGPSGSYPAGVGNLFPNMAAFQAYFEDYNALDFHLAVGSPAIAAGTAGSDIGADVDAVLAATELVIIGGTPPVIVASPTITTLTLPAGQIGVPYAFQMTAVDGTLPYTWSVFSGALPDGLTLNASSGVISGTPTGTAATANFTIRVTDAA